MIEENMCWGCAKITRQEVIEKNYVRTIRCLTCGAILKQFA